MFLSLLIWLFGDARFLNGYCSTVSAGAYTGPGDTKVILNDEFKDAGSRQYWGGLTTAHSSMFIRHKNKATINIATL